MTTPKVTAGLALGQTEEDVEGQVYILKRPVPGEPGLDDTEGQGGRYLAIELESDDAEGHGAHGSYLVPATDEEVEGQGYKAGVLRQVEDDSEGHGLRLSLEPDDTEGHARWP